MNMDRKLVQTSGARARSLFFGQKVGYVTVVTRKSNIITLNKLLRVLHGSDANIWHAGPVSLTT
jgi:hypothetical protein